MLSACCMLSCASEESAQELADHQRREAFREDIRRILGEKYEEPVPAADPIQLERGKYLYAELCSACHGGLGRGRGKFSERLTTRPFNFTDPEEVSFYSEQARLYIIKNGVPGTTMFGWKENLTEPDILAIYGHVRSFIKQ